MKFLPYLTKNKTKKTTKVAKIKSSFIIITSKTCCNWFLHFLQLLVKPWPNF